MKYRHSNTHTYRETERRKKETVYVNVVLCVYSKGERAQLSEAQAKGDLSPATSALLN